MKVQIKQVSNGFILKIKEHDVVQTIVIEAEGNAAVVELLDTLASLYGEYSKYNEDNIHVVRVPGDSYEGEIDEQIRFTMEAIAGTILEVLEEDEFRYTEVKGEVQ